MSADIKKLAEDNTIFLSVIGSHAYGTNLPTSDEDFGGVCIIPDKSYYIGNKNFEQADQWKDSEGNKIDKTIYSIRKIIFLMLDNNPNCLDLLFVPERCYRILKPEWQKFIEIREDFLCSKLRYTLSGYAFSQLQRIKNHRQYLLNPPKGKPQRVDFGLPEISTFPDTQLEAIAKISTNFVKQEDRRDFHNEAVEIINKDFYLLYLKYMEREMANLAVHDFQKDMINWLNLLCSIQGIFLKEEWLDMAQRELKYIHAKRDYDSYENWKNTRNEKRKILEAKCGYDCYSDDTEFLTKDGFKKYDNITKQDKLATIYVNFTKKYKNTHRQEFQVEYQKYIDRFESLYTGDMYNFYGYHTDIMVTPNHNMLIKEYAKNVDKYFGDWRLEQCSNLPDTFEVFFAPNPKLKNYCDNDYFKDCPISRMNFMSLMGWYLSDGTMNFRKDSPKAIRISQKKGGRLHWQMSRFINTYKSKIGGGLYFCERNPNAFNPNKITEVSLIVTNRWLVEKFLIDCGYTDTKKIPIWVYDLSSRLQNQLLRSLMLGDGTKRNIKRESIDTWIYYSKSKSLADDVQRLAMHCGYETSLWGPYKCNNREYDLEMYQVSVNFNSKSNKTLTCCDNIKKIPVANQRIVCFTVPNSLLITRRNGRIAIQGNSKHAQHAIRLLTMGKEYLASGKYNIDRTNIDAEELIDIRLGNQNFETVMSKADKLLEEVESLYKITTVPKHPKREKIEEMLMETIDEYVWRKK